MNGLVKSFSLMFLITLVGLEVALRLYNPIFVPLRADEIQLPVNRTFTQTNVNNSKVDESVVNKYNGIGLRGPEYPEDPQQYTKIFTVGGSTTACVTLTDGRTWPDRVAKRLSESTENTWLNNAGMNGHSTFGHLVLLNNHLAKFKPDYVVYLIGVNDVGRADLNSYDAKMIGRDEPLLNRLVANSELLSTVRVLKRSLLAFDKGLNVHSHLDLPSVPNRVIDPSAREAELSLHKRLYLGPYRERVIELVNRTISFGAVPVLVTQPALYGYGMDPATNLVLDRLETGRKQLPAKTEWEVLELYNDVLRSLSANDGVILIDLARELPKNSDYYFDWIHYSNKGAEMVGDLVANRLLSQISRPQHALR